MILGRPHPPHVKCTCRCDYISIVQTVAGVGFRDIVRTLKVRLFTTKVIKSHVKLQVKSNVTKIPPKNFSACHNTLRGIKLATSQANRLRSACSLAITLYQTHIVLCPRQVQGARPKKGLSSSKHSSVKLIKAFHKSISKSLFGKRTEAFFRSLPTSELHGIHRNDQILD